MKPFRFFRAPFAAFTVIFSLTCGLAFAQIPNPQNNAAFANAVRLETESPTQAMDSYFKVTNAQSGQNKELAAESLVRAMQFGVKVLDPRQNAPTSDLARAQREEIQSIVGDRAHEASKQLLSGYRTTNAAKFAEEKKLQYQLEQLLDKRNSTTPTYKIIDGLVAATGRVPSFSYWFALLFIAIAVKTITFPLTLKMYKSQREMQKIQPLMKEIQEKYKGKPELSEKTMALYKEHGVNPMASCLPMLIQMPFLLWVYNMIRLYEFHFQSGKFLWIGSDFASNYPMYLAASLGAFDIVLVTVYALSNYLTMKLTPPSDPSMANQQKSMAVMMTAMMFFFSLQFRWAAAFTFYWLCLNFISTYQQYKYIYKPNKIKAAMPDGVEIILPGETKSISSGSKGSSTATNNGSRVRTTSPGTVTPLTPVPNDAMRARPRRKPKK